MLKIKIDKLLDLMADQVCEYCGISSKTTLCSACHEELIQTIQKSPQKTAVDDRVTEEPDI